MFSGIRDRKNKTGDEWGELTPDGMMAFVLAQAPHGRLMRQPLFRRVYFWIWIIQTFSINIPFWTLCDFRKSKRPRASWSLEKCLRVRFFRSICQLVANCEIDYTGNSLQVVPNPLDLKVSHLVDIPPVPLEILRGHPVEMLRLLHDSRGSWDPHFVYRPRRDVIGIWGKWNPPAGEERTYGSERVQCFWYTGTKSDPAEPLPPRRPGENVMIYFHGGGYIFGSAMETDIRGSIIPKYLAENSPVRRILSVNYRLAPQAPWPLPLIDAISVYWHLVKEEGIAESNIIVSGDSAGAHLALALVRWLRDEGGKVGLEIPSGLVVLSPWVDVGFTNVWGNEGWHHNANSDTLDAQFGPYAASLLLRALPASIMHTSPYLSPASLLLTPESTGPNSFERFPPVFLVYGGAERIARSIQVFWGRLQLARKAEVYSGSVRDELMEGVDAVHDFMIYPWCAEEAEVVYERMNSWLETLLQAKYDGLGAGEGTLLADVEVPMKSARSPPMSPNRHGVFSMMQDMLLEGRSIKDPKPLESQLVETAKEWMSPLTSAFLFSAKDWVGDDEKDRC